MPSPFVGMDPFLEEEHLWPWFQHQLAITLERVLTRRIAPVYSVRISERPDRGGEWLGVYSTAKGRLLTRLDIVSPATKLTSAGRSAYRDVRRTALESGVSIAEIDLVLRGEPLPEYRRAGLPAWDYAVTVTRSTNPGRHDIYPNTLGEPLSWFRVPTPAWDAGVDLQKAFSRTYEDCGFADQIDYGKSPAVSLGAETLRRVGGVLRKRQG